MLSGQITRLALTGRKISRLYLARTSFHAVWKQFNMGRLIVAYQSIHACMHGRPPRSFGFPSWEAGKRGLPIAREDTRPTCTRELWQPRGAQATWQVLREDHNQEVPEYRPRCFRGAWQRKKEKYVKQMSYVQLLTTAPPWLSL